MDWFRSYHGAPTDPKWRAIAKRAGVRPIEVAAVVWALLDHASQQDDRGDVTQFDIETIATSFDVEMTTIETILKALNDKGVLVNGRVFKWEKYQPKREDSSTERVRRFRETNGNATKRDETVEKTREEKNRADKKDTPIAPKGAFERFWEAYPEKVGKGAAKRHFERAVKIVDIEALLAAVARYRATKPADRPWCNPATYLSQQRWTDEPAPAPMKPIGLYGGAMQ